MRGGGDGGCVLRDALGGKVGDGDPAEGAQVCGKAAAGEEVGGGLGAEVEREVACGAFSGKMRSEVGGGGADGVFSVHQK